MLLQSWGFKGQPDSATKNLPEKHGLQIELFGCRRKWKCAASAYGVWVEKNMYGPHLHGHRQRSTF